MWVWSYLRSLKRNNMIDHTTSSQSAIASSITKSCTIFKLLHIEVPIGFPQ